MSKLTNWGNGNTEQKNLGFKLYFVHYVLGAASPAASPRSTVLTWRLLTAVGNG